MLHSFKYKVLLAGLEDPRKIPIFNDSSFDKNDFFQIGISLNSIECYSSTGDLYLFIFWHLNPGERFKFMIPSFFVGSKAALLCLDKSNYHSLEQVKAFLRIMHERNEEIPIILLVFSSKNGHIEVEKGDLLNLINDYKIDEYNLTTFDSEKLNYLEKKRFFKFLIKKLKPILAKDHSWKKLSLIFPMDVDGYQEFSKTYGFCPICKNHHHEENLKDFYFSKTHNLMMIRDRFLKLQELLKGKTKHLKVTLGIPCCSCLMKLQN